jgi:hypothetical protein
MRPLTPRNQRSYELPSLIILPFAILALVAIAALVVLFTLGS